MLRPLLLIYLLLKKEVTNTETRTKTRELITETGDKHEDMIDWGDRKGTQKIITKNYII